MYYPEGLKQDDDIKWMYNIDGNRYLVCGDFNCHSPLWNAERLQAENGGQFIEKILEEVDLCILNDGTITRIPEVSNHRPSAIDLTFCSSSMFIKTDWIVLDDPLGSDHIPIQVSYTNSPETIPNCRKKKFIYDKANWPLFRSILENSEYPNNFNEVDSWYKNFQQIILSAADRSIPSTNNPKSSDSPKRINEWWNNDCHKQRAIYRKLVKKYKRCRTTENLDLMKKQKIEYNKTLANAKLKFWTNYVDENVNSYRDCNLLYKKLKSVKGRFDPPEQPLEVNGVKTTNTKEKAEIFAKTFASVSQNSSLSREQLRFRMQEESKFETPVFNNSPENSDFTETELNRALFCIKKYRKATGSDPISYTMIKRFPCKTKVVLLKYFNYLWSSGSLPSCWKEAQVSAIPKPGKPKKDPKSYRPIALTPHVSKVYERLVKNRLEYYLEKNNLLPKCQSGFRRGRSCIENLVKLSSHVKRAMMRRRPVLATFYDIKRAYDTVWHKKLLDKLLKIGISRNMFHFFESFLENRIIRVAVGSDISAPQVLDMGIPQGSIVAPIAFSVMLGDIHKLNLRNASISLYADDLAMWSTSKYRRTDIKSFQKNEIVQFQKNIDLIVEYMETNGFCLAPDKTVFMIFSSGQLKSNISINIYDTTITPSQEVKYLGVILDRTFSFKSHIDHLIKKTRKNLYLIKVLKRENSLTSLALLRTLFVSLVRSRLTYGQEIFHSAPITYLQKLQSTETAIIKNLLNIPKTANPILVYREIGLKPLSFVRKLQTTRTTFRLGGTENDIVEELGSDFNNKHSGLGQSNFLKRPQIFRKGTSITDYVKDLVETAEIGDSAVEIKPQCRFHCPPWEEIQYDITSSFGNYNKTNHIHILTTFAREKQENLKDHLCIYTDGSIHTDGSSGCAFVVPEFNIVRRFRLNKDISIFSAELFAIERAMSFVGKRVIHDKICIFTDSRAALQALENQSFNRHESISYILNITRYLQQNEGKTIKFQWIPSHSGLKGNEWADKAAKEAAKDPYLPINDIGLTLTEVSAKLDAASDRLWHTEFRQIANALKWCDPDKTQVPPFVAPPKYSQVFHRLRCNTTRFDIFKTLCCCHEGPVTVTHIFNCKELYNQLLLTRTYCSRENIPFSHLGLMSYHEKFGWEPAKTFIYEIVNSDIGHLL